MPINVESPVATSLVSESLFRLAKAIAHDPNNEEKILLLQQTVVSTLTTENNDALLEVLKRCHQDNDPVTFDLFDAAIEQLSSQRTFDILGDQQETNSYLVAIPVTLAAKNCTWVRDVHVNNGFSSLSKSVANLCSTPKHAAAFFLSDYLYHPQEVIGMSLSEIYQFPEHLIQHAATSLPEDVINATLCRTGWPEGHDASDDLGICLFYLLGVVVTNGPDPFEHIDDETMLDWRAEVACHVEEALQLQKDEAFALVGDIDLFFQSVRNGSSEHKEFAFDLEVENLILRDKHSPKALTVLIAQYGDGDAVEQVHVSVLGILDNALYCGFVYQLESHESNRDVIDGLIDTLHDWDIESVKVMEDVFMYEHAYLDGEAVFIKQQEAGVDLKAEDIVKTPRTLH